MSFVLRLFLLYFLIIGSLAWFILQKSIDTLENSVRQSAEEVMVDSANFIAELVSQNVIVGEIQLHQIHNLIPAYLERRLNAKIYSVIKHSPDLQVYITDRHGQVLYDSLGVSEGEDFSRWNDVFLTLRGQYGVRTSMVEDLEVLEEDAAKALYIAAPVVWKDEIVGVVTVSKGIAHLDPFILTASRQLKQYALFVFAMSIVFGILMTWWLSRSMRKLVNYAELLGARKSVPAPRLREVEFSKLAVAMSDMREALDDKEYVEDYLHSVAHELKSPLTGLSASAELLAQTHDPATRASLVDNISESTQRMNTLVERMLNLASVEKRHRLDKVSSIDLRETVNQLIEDSAATGVVSHVELRNEVSADHHADGDPILLRQAISNLLDNAVGHSPDGSVVTVKSELTDGQMRLHLSDQGSGIPDYALDRIFDRFYSIPRPGSRLRNSGLGLSFVREVMKLHQGTVTLKNNDSGKGATATLQWPVRLEST